MKDNMNWLNNLLKDKGRQSDKQNSSKVGSESREAVISHAVKLTVEEYGPALQKLAND